MAWKFKVTEKSEIDTQGTFEVRGDIIFTNQAGAVVSTFPNFTFRGTTRQAILNAAIEVVARLVEAAKEVNKIQVGEEVEL